MANFSLVANTSFTRRNYDDLTKSLDKYKEEYDKQHDAINELGVNAAAIESMANEQTDPIAYNTYKQYANNLREQANMIATNGLDPNGRASLLKLKRNYAEDIIPITAAFTKRAEQDKAQMEILSKDPTHLFDRLASTTSLDDYIANKSLGYQNYSGALLTKQVSDAASKYSELLQEDIDRVYNGHGNLEDTQVLRQLTPESREKVLRLYNAGYGHAGNIERSGVALEQILAKDSIIRDRITNEVLNASGINNWQNYNAIKGQVEGYLDEGMHSALGKFKTQYFQIPTDSTRGRSGGGGNFFPDPSMYFNIVPITSPGAMNSSSPYYVPTQINNKYEQLGKQDNEKLNVDANIKFRDNYNKTRHPGLALLNEQYLKSLVNISYGLFDNGNIVSDKDKYIETVVFNMLDNMTMDNRAEIMRIMDKDNRRVNKKRELNKYIQWRSNKDAKYELEHLDKTKLSKGIVKIYKDKKGEVNDIIKSLYNYASNTYDNVEYFYKLSDDYREKNNMPKIEKSEKGLKTLFESGVDEVMKDKLYESRMWTTDMANLPLDKDAQNKVLSKITRTLENGQYKLRKVKKFNPESDNEDVEFEEDGLTHAEIEEIKKNNTGSIGVYAPLEGKKITKYLYLSINGKLYAIDKNVFGKIIEQPVAENSRASEIQKAMRAFKNQRYKEMISNKSYKIGDDLNSYILNSEYARAYNDMMEGLKNSYDTYTKSYINAITGDYSKSTWHANEDKGNTVSR